MIFPIRGIRRIQGMVCEILPIMVLLIVLHLMRDLATMVLMKIMALPITFSLLITEKAESVM